MVRKGENASDQHFFLFPQFFQHNQESYPMICASKNGDVQIESICRFCQAGNNLDVAGILGFGC